MLSASYLAIQAEFEPIKPRLGAKVAPNGWYFFAQSD
jgi:hypothetical protein